MNTRNKIAVSSPVPTTTPGGATYILSEGVDAAPLRRVSCRPTIWDETVAKLRVNIGRWWSAAVGRIADSEAMAVKQLINSRHKHNLHYIKQYSSAV